MSAEQIWMREPSIQCREEIKFYQEIFEFVLNDIMQIQSKGIITEGAAYLPQLMRKANVPVERYFTITPTKEFQVFYYKKREWVPYVLEGCSDKEKAFSNWMERDILFAEEVRRQCCEEKYVSLVNDGNIKIEEMVSRVAMHFGLVE